MTWRVLAAGTLARVPSEGIALAVVLTVTGRGGSTAFAGLLLALTTLPQVVTGPLGGSLLDRATRPGRVVAAAAMVAAAALTALAVGDGAGVWAVCAALVLAGADPILTGGLSATFTRWAEPGGLSAHTVSAWDGVAYNVAGVAGPLVVTIVAAAAGPAAALGALAAVIAPTAVIALGGPQLPVTAHAGGLRALAALRAMWADRPLRGVTVATTVEQAALGGMTIALVAAAAAHGHAAEAAGTVLTVRAVTALASSLALTRWGATVAPLTIVSASVAAGGVGLVVMGLVPWWLLVGVAAVVGLADGPVLVGTYRARADGSPPNLRASVFTVGASLKLAASSAGSLMAGVALADRSTSGGLVVIGAVCLAGTAAGRMAGRPGQVPTDRAENSAF